MVKKKTHLLTVFDLVHAIKLKTKIVINKRNISKISRCRTIHNIWEKVYLIEKIYFVNVYFKWYKVKTISHTEDMLENIKFEKNAPPCHHCSFFENKLTSILLCNRKKTQTKPKERNDLLFCLDWTIHDQLSYLNVLLLTDEWCTCVFNLLLKEKKKRIKLF